MKKNVSILLAILICLSVITTPAQAEDDTVTSYTIRTRLDEKLFTGSVYDYKIQWSDSFFGEESTFYNHELAKACAVLSTAVYCNKGEKDRTVYIGNALKTLGFKDDTVHTNYYNDSSSSTVAYSFGHKTIVNNGKQYELIIVVIRGTPPTDEWVGNFDIGQEAKNGTTHLNFTGAEEELAESFSKYIRDKLSKVDKPYKVLITGHSRGGAVANLLAKDIVEGDNTIKIPISNVYAYTFAAPNTVINPSKQYENIFNIVNDEDFVPAVPLEKWGYEKYGNTYSLPKSFKYSDSFITSFKNLSSEIKLQPYNFDGVVSDVIKDMNDAAPTIKSYYNDSHSVSLNLEQTPFVYFRNQICTAILKPSKILSVSSTSAIGQSAYLYTNSKLSPISKFFAKYSNDICFAHTSNLYISWLYSLESDWISSVRSSEVNINANDTMEITTINKNMTVDVGVGSTLRFCSTVSTADNARIGSISNGATVYVYGNTKQTYENRIWAKIRYNNKDGWVNAQYLKNEGSTTPPPKAQTISVTNTVESNFIVTIPANTTVFGYSSSTSTDKMTLYSPKASSFKLYCTKQLTMSDGTTRYFFRSGGSTAKDYYLLFTSAMSVTGTSTSPSPAPAPTTGTITIEYNANGGSGAPTTHSVVKNSSGSTFCTISSAKPTRDGYIFNGWWRDNEYTYGTYQPGQSIQVGEGRTNDITVTLYAQWKAEPLVAGTVTVKYDANGGTNAPPSQTGIRDTKGTAVVIIPNVIPTKSGYTFAGWLYPTGPYTNDLLQPGGKVVFSSSRDKNTIVLTASWEASTPIYQLSVKFSNMRVYWDTGWGDDELFVSFSHDCFLPVTEVGYKFWDSSTLDEIQYIDSPIGTSGCIHSIQPDGSYHGSLVPGRTYNWIGYIVCNGKRYESPVQTYVFSTQGSRYGE